jgi:hypothetical protein
MRHYLEPSIRAPKRFLPEQPPAKDDDDDETQSAWLECLLRVSDVGPLCALVGNNAGQTLARSLWELEDIPTNCVAVVQVTVELLTGRTHQIRGQLSASGYPLVGDAQYGGSKPSDVYDAGRLALQCCGLEFLDPDVAIKMNGETTMNRSNRRNKFQLEQAWWTPMTRAYMESTQQELSAEESTTSVSDVLLSSQEPRQQKSSSNSVTRPDLLPNRVALAPGKNKYVLVKATHPMNGTEEWFVKSATPKDCGGPYHGNVAQDVREWIQAAGYDVVVTGGGRIDYRKEEGRAIVYGFSYGFGRGDHDKACKIINEFGDGKITAEADYSSELY